MRLGLSMMFLVCVTLGSAAFEPCFGQTAAEPTWSEQKNALVEPRPEVKFDWAPSQITGTYRYTADDYSLLLPNGLIERSRLNGGALEFAWHRLYPWEVVGTAIYSQGKPLGQRLATGAVGIGYTRAFHRALPYARLQAGISRTSSTDSMYLFRGPQWGFTTVESVGLDFRVTPHWGLRPIHLQNEYLPFGSHGSVYWSAGAGFTYNIRP